MASQMDQFVGEFGKSFISIAWRDDGLFDGLSNGEKRVQAKLDAVLQRYAPEVENWMKNEAPWTDQTGNARNGLAARHYRDAGSVGIILYHQVPYGIWLEVKQSGKYAIIGPALEYWGPTVMEGTRNMLGEI